MSSASPSTSDRILTHRQLYPADLQAANQLTSEEFLHRIFNDPRFVSLFDDAQFSQASPLLEKVLSGEDLNPDEVLEVNCFFNEALKRATKAMFWVEKNLGITEGDNNKNESPPDIRSFIDTLVSTVELFYEKLKTLSAEKQPDPEDPIPGMIEELSSRFVSALNCNLPESVDSAQSDTRKAINRALRNLEVVVKIDIPKGVETTVYSTASSRSDVAFCTTGERLLKNLKDHEFDPKEYRVIVVRLSGTLRKMVVPKNDQGVIALVDLFDQFGFLATPEELDEVHDIAFLGVEDDVFDGVEGTVQAKKNKLVKVDGGYKRFHITASDGSSIYVVGRRKDLCYLGYLKKLFYQMLGTRQLQDSVQLLASNGVEVTQPSEMSKSLFRYKTSENPGVDLAEIVRKLITPIHGTANA